ncbi:hypothetical protein LINPERHAP2_LOCUS28753 [Linum perenne]
MSQKRKDDDNGDARRKYFPWTDELDQILVRNMHTLVVDKKIDPKGKFNPGAYDELERMMLVDKPGCGIKADPNIISRVKTLKAKFLALQELRGLSGVGWDDSDKQVDIDDNVYAEYVANHSHCAKLNRVPFPLYDALAFVYGKGRATGKTAVGLEELNQACPPIDEPDWIDTEEVNDHAQGGDMETQPNERTTPPPMVEEQTATFPNDKTMPSEASSQPKRVRRSKATSGGEVAELKPILEDAVSSLKSMMVESDVVHSQRNMLFDELKKIDGLTMAQVMDATVSLGKDDRMLQIFFNMTDPEDRKCLVERVIR